MTIGKKIHINGIVQGVGFRPFIYAQAKKYAITGWVRNSSSGVDIVANGDLAQINDFINSIKLNAPPLSVIDEIQVQDSPNSKFTDFSIITSQSRDHDFIPVSPDVSICEDCLEELFNPLDRRYRYPFTNCTNCGPRFTIIQDIPYDRPLTTMAAFPMCADCRKEYEDPLNRRFHAQPIACPNCGPKIWFESADTDNPPSENENALITAREFIREGKIIAVKGLGGFHLVCDATNESTVKELRARKMRTDKPFALMVADTLTAGKYCQFSVFEETLLKSRARPVVILDRKSGINLPNSIAPNVNTLGIMLPYTPLHYLLLESEADYPDVLIMTSGNISEEPIAYTNETAKSDLSTLVDGYLLNNRDIETRMDDSVVSESSKSIYFFRRSRGYAPQPLRFKKKMRQVLATGAELKNTFCLTKDHYAFLSHHIGDLQNLETYSAYEQSISQYEKIFKASPEFIACDMHPDYLSTRYATERSCDQDLEVFPVQHHHAHLASVLGDNNWESNEPVLGLCFDGTGYGNDGAIWGGEILFGGYTYNKRKYHLEYMPLPGGDAAIRHPGRIAAAYLWKFGKNWDLNIPAIASLNIEERNTLDRQLRNDLNCPKTSSMGRLFDAVAGLIGLRLSVNYEAQAAIELENLIDPSVSEAYSFKISNDEIQIKDLIENILDDFKNKLPLGKISAKFHNGIRLLALDSCGLLSRETGCKTIALSGGVWQNRFLVRSVKEDLEKNGYQVLVHKNIPANDGGIALGQALVANYSMKG